MSSSCLKMLHLISLALLCSLSSVLGTNVSYDSSAIIIDGQRRILISGSIHYPRSTPQMWPDLIKKAKEGSVDVIETYIFWDRHEPRRRQYDFSGNLDIVKFFKLVQQGGLYGFLRIGPYACAEWTYGGFPVWLHNTNGIELRTNNDIFKNEMQTFVAKVIDVCKQAKLFASQGGPIILAQIENEYGNIMGPYGDAGQQYLKWCAQMAQSFNIGIPWVMCQQDNAPPPMINTCNGYYCDQFTPNSASSPKIWTENWIGWFKNWGGQDPHRTAEDCAFAVARFFQISGVMQNYYMYHGGTNFGRTSGGPYITTSYDYDAPLDEYGNLNQPKWGHLKQLHDAIKSGEKMLTMGSPKTTNLGNGNLTMYTNNATGEKFCFLSNESPSVDNTVDLKQDGQFFVPAWSVSILQNCSKEIFNTAKVNTQTSVMVKKPSISGIQLSWTWVAEPIDDTLGGKGTFTKAQLLEQKAAAVDASDYLWYMTNVPINGSDWSNANLSVTTSGQVLHVFVNGKFVGSQWGAKGDDSFTFVKPVALNPGNNILSLLSATVGFKNYGSFFDKQPAGINGGPVKFIGSGNAEIDVSTYSWAYKIGLNGIDKQFFNDQSSNGVKWSSSDLQTRKAFTWYKTTFQTPPGTDPVVLDLQGMGKGMAWVNGQSIGRFWPSFMAGGDGCSNSCDYRGAYGASKCVTNCENPTQRWYHVPRSFLNNSNKNSLVLFEELGGNPSNVSVQTVTVGTACVNAYEGSKLEISCQGGNKISDVEFASFGNPSGQCNSFQKGSCDSDIALSVVQQACVGEEMCSFTVTKETFGSTSCGNTNRLAVQATC
ncbi:hypothetical protein K2173_017464 [Erythroxylum novogranatense]|uniref:Beta-galactosidase n=1 Tax=Erythroxylum novogranatense TaxID=1862640 RepID=A0AAV8TMF1_9ROSI|nr:hypothetical protein K2173_017464 [Erythroxylum novogranatense]